MFYIDIYEYFIMDIQKPIGSVFAANLGQNKDLHLLSF